MIVMLLAWGASLANGQPQLAPLATMVQLSLALADDRPVYQRASVSLNVEVLNLTDKKLTVSLVLAPFDHRYVRVLYRKMHEPFRELTYTREWQIEEPRDPWFDTFSLDPHGRGRLPLRLAVDPGRSDFLFGEPGDYEVQVVSHAKWRRPDDVIATAPLRIHVDPAPPSEADALVDWDVDLALFAQDDGGSGGPHFRREVTRALKFIDKHPVSLYSRLLRQRTVDTLHRLRREGIPLTEYEKDAFERLKATLREEAQRDAAQR